jgi:tetratricopeptide (TPR) repeat protein
MFMCALSAVWALAAFTSELYLRNFRRIETIRFQDEAEATGATEAFAMVRRLQRTVRTCLLVEPILVFACVIPYRAQRMERSMLGVVADAARETAEECRGAERICTGGGLGATVELAAARAGRSLRALSLMGGVEDPREAYLRTRGVSDARDRALLESGAADALRLWVRSRPDKASSYAVQIGFELWRRDGRPMPECSGLVARPAGFSPGEAERGAAVARELAKRLLALYGKGDPDRISDRLLRDAFLFVQWRLAILARHRANAYDERRETALAMEETRIADALDKKNGALARIRATMAWASQKKLERMTPQEGLRLGLSRADFALARLFALRGREISPDDPAADFALGTAFFVQKQYSRAQAYLERCLKGRPDDPAVLNNLAQCHLRQGDPAGALPYAERAQSILPESSEVRRTIERVKAALKEKN